MGDTLYCVIPRIDPAYTEDMKRRLDDVCGDYLVTIPQEGDILE